MAGNTRGKLKEHFEGIHKNIDWCLHHINQSLALIEGELKMVQVAMGLPDDDATMIPVLAKNPVYQAAKSLGEGLQTFDELSQGIYASL